MKSHATSEAGILAGTRLRDETRQHKKGRHVIGLAITRSHSGILA
jgi:hypothetical protein